MPFDPSSQAMLALRDLSEGALRRSVWGLLGWQDIKRRYRRSMLGPFWLTISTGIMILVLGAVYAAVLKVDVNEYFPFFAVGLVVWNLLSTLAIDACDVYISSELMIKQLKLPLFVYPLRMVWRNLIIFAHNFVIVIAVLAYFRIVPSPGHVLVFFVGLGLVALNGLWVGVVLGAVCARFRDIPQIVTNLVQLLFFVTPVLWLPSLLPGRHRVIEWNPAYHFVEILRAPLLSRWPAPTTWVMVFAVTLLGWTAATLVMVRFRRRIPYWV